MKVTIDEITDLLQIARYGLYDTRDTYFLCQGLYERIKKHGIAPPEGMCIVPIEPTQAMYDAGYYAGSIGSDCWDYAPPDETYKAMLSAVKEKDNEQI